ncbi:MAG: RNA-directed DNA polymerase [Chloroflexi bacterium]|nr:RNA-directed DNA polymerase [Chloroflexota bacterium]MCL5273520.1 RNA-directed DNA polymerase [Chloroflexota bacterium]
MSSIYEDIIRWDNLWSAFHNAARGKRGHADVAAFEYHLADNLLQLQTELRDQSYKPGVYHSFYIHEPKRRLISAAPFRDRVAHHALCNVTIPLLERWFIPDSYANRAGKGTHRALDRCQEFARRYPYVLSCDVVQFFPSIDHGILRETLIGMLRSADLLWLIDAIMQSGCGVLSEEYNMVYFPGDDLFAVNRPRGLPIGNLTSQWWANCHLNPFDQFVKRELGCPAYMRYVDDFLLFGDDLKQLWAWREQIVQRLARFRLTIHLPQAHPYPVNEGIPFLGFVVFPDRRRLKRRKGLAFRRKLRTLVKTAPYQQIDAVVQGWINHVRFGNTYGLRKAVLADAGLLAEEGGDGR